MNSLRESAVAAWKAADLAACDAEALLRVQVLKYEAGIGGPPEDPIFVRSVELRRIANESLLQAIQFLGTVEGLRHCDPPHTR